MISPEREREKRDSWGTHKQLSPLEKVIFDNFFKCNHLIIKWHFVGKRTKNYFLKWTQQLKFRKFCLTRPEGAEALSPGQRPGYNGNQQCALFYSN